MGEKDRARTKLFQLHLFEEEMDVLAEKARLAGVTKTDYIRYVIMYGSAGKAANFSSEDSRSIQYELNRIGNNINQIAYRVNARATVDVSDFNNLQSLYDDLLIASEAFVIG